MKILFVLVLLVGNAWGWHRFNSGMNAKFSTGKLVDPSKSVLRSIISIVTASSIVFGALNIDPSTADSRLNAPTAAGTRVNSDADSLLRYGLPIKSKELRDIQAAVESAKLNLKTRRIQFAEGDVNNALNLVTKNEAKILQQAPANHKKQSAESIQRFKADIDPLLASMRAYRSAGSGSLQERKGLDDSFAAQENLAQELTVLEELAVPDDFARRIPDEYKLLPKLNRRATIEMVVKKPDGSQYDVDGVLFDKVRLKLVVDGYNAPLTGGNFVDLVSNGFYNGMKISRSDGFVVQTGDPDPEGSIHGYVPEGKKEVRTIPLEISLKGDDDLLFGVTTEDDGRGYAATSLPFQSYGALGMARTEFEPDSASSQFFWLLFESDLTPAGKNLLDGRYACFGYTVEGADKLKAVQEGDIIESAKIVDGIQYFVKGQP